MTLDIESAKPRTETIHFLKSRLANWLISKQQAYGAVLHIVIIACVCIVVVIGPINVVVLQFIHQACVLMEFVEKITGEFGPSLKNFSSFMKSSEEAALLSPDQVFVLFVHPIAVDCIKMRNGNHNHCVVVLHIGKLLRERIVLYLVAKSRRRLRNLVVEDSASEECLHVEDVVAFLVVKRQLLRSFFLVLPISCYCDGCLADAVCACVDVALMNLYRTAQV